MLPLSHHAVLVRGTDDRVLAMLADQLGFDPRTVAHSDVRYERHETFGIDEARTLARAALAKPIERDVVRFIISTENLTPEAQNALLKLTEDPPLSARFVFVLPSSHPILPTFRSRLIEVIAEERGGVRMPSYETVGDELEAIAKMAKDADADSMERYLRESEWQARKTNDVHLSRAVLLARKYIEARGASAKMLLEHVALARRSAGK